MMMMIMIMIIIIIVVIHYIIETWMNQQIQLRRVSDQPVGHRAARAMRMDHTARSVWKPCDDHVMGVGVNIRLVS